MKRFLPALLIPVLVHVAGAQTGSRTTTNAACSPIVTGGSSQITINCNGLSPAKATELVSLMNRILAERLDLSVVNTKLDQLHTDIGGLNATLNPFQNAPAPVLALLKQSDVLITQCSNRAMNWIYAESDARQQAINSRRLGMNTKATSTSDSDARHSLEFSRSFAPRLLSLNTQLHKLMPDAPVIIDVPSPISPMQASSYASQVFSLSLRYQRSQRDMGRPADTRLFSATNSAFQDSTVFCRSWIDDNQAALLAGKQQNASNLNARQTSLSDLTANIDTREATQYRTDLEPQLINYRNQVTSQMPEFSPSADYQAVTSGEQLGRVCSDVASLTVAYKRKVAEDLQKQRQLPARAH